MKIIHMSDLHVGYQAAGDKFSRMVRELIARKSAGEWPAEVVVITGDLVHRASTASYDEVRAGLDALREAGFLVLAAPGNHDYRSSSDRLLKRADRANIKKFQQAFFGRETGYPKLDLVGTNGTAAAFIGLDSMAERFRLHDAVWDHGEFGAWQLDALERMLGEDRVREAARRIIYFHHHPFEQVPLARPHDSEQLREIIGRARRDGVPIDALLYGHNHFGAADPGRWGVERCYNGGTATTKRRPLLIDWVPWGRPRAATRLIDLEATPDDDRALDLD